MVYVIRRLLAMIVTFFLITIISFMTIQLPPGDMVTNWVREQEALAGSRLPDETIENLRARFGFGEPLLVQYLKWVAGFPQGDFGFTILYGEASVASIVGPRIGITYFIVIVTLLLSWGLAIPLGIYAATHQNTLTDYLLSSVSFIGISVPNFLLAVVYLFFAIFVFNTNYSGGLFSREFENAPWSWPRLVDFATHLVVPLLILGLGGMAGTYRIMRANLMDVLGQQYVETARAKGLAERVVIYKHAARIAINPLISRLGMQLPVLLGGTVILSIVLDLPTLGPPFYRALLRQDMFLAGTILMILAVTLLVGNFIADLLLAWSDPRIRLDE
jgi:peptide/nickel transport system permease protein